MSITAVLPAAALLAGFLWLPGLAIARAAGLRGLALWSLAPHVTLTVLTTLCVLAPMAGLSWSWVSLAVSTVVFASASWGVRAVVMRRRGSTGHRDGADTARPPGQARRRPDPTPLLATLLGAGLVLAASVPGMGRVDAVPQSPDMSFHVNTIRWMVDHGDFSALHALNATPATTGGFYPTGFHDWVATTLTLVHVPVLTATNLAALVIASLLWPAGCVLLVRQVLGGTRLQLLVAGVLSASFVAFPYYLMSWGVLWPNELGLALVPGVLALVASLLGLGARELMPRLPAAVLLLATLPGLTVAHPNALVTAGGFVVCMVVGWVVRAFQRTTSPARWWLLVAGGATLVAIGAITVLLPKVSTTFRLTFHYPSKPFESAVAATTDMVLNNPRGFTALWGLSAL
ncbi:MAG TPA: DUF6541 family protein, partial [Oryzihumus sp.]|nr:DUF6541 family protein [Oryzihumus sp.]